MDKRLPVTRTATARAAFAALFVGLGAWACGGSGTVASLRIAHAWARTTPPSATAGVVYLTIRSPLDDDLTGVSVDPVVATSATMHETMGSSDDGGMANMPGMASSGSGAMTMVPLDKLPVRKGSDVEFRPGGKHIMLEGLSKPLEAGAHFELRLHFAAQGDQRVDVEVRDNAP